MKFDQIDGIKIDSKLGLQLSSHAEKSINI